MVPQRHLLLACLLLGLAARGVDLALVDSFDGVGKVEWLVHQGDWQVREGLYHVGGTGRSFVAGAVLDDGVVQVDCRIVAPGPLPADWAGVVVGADAQASSAAGQLVYIRYSGEVELYSGAQILAVRKTNAQAAFAQGRSVRLTVQVKARHVTVQVDGEASIEADVPDYRPGSVGLASYDAKAEFDNLVVRGESLGYTITGEVLLLPANAPVPGAKVEIYHSMDGYNSLVTRETLADAHGRYRFSGLPAGDKAYWLRCSKDGYGGSTGWFVSVTDAGPTVQELYLIPAPRHDLWVDSSSVLRSHGFQPTDDPQCYGGSRLVVKQMRPAAERPEWWAELEVEVPREGDYVPYFAAGQYPAPYYWSDFAWSIDGAGPLAASQTLRIEGPRYGDRATMAWASGPVQPLGQGRHVLRVVLHDPAPHAGAAEMLPYWWSFDAACLAELPRVVSPANGERVADPQPELRWIAPASAERFTVQYSEDPDFGNATVTVGGVRGDRLRVRGPLADGTYHWRVKALTEEESLFTAPFSPAQRFVVATDRPAIEGVQVRARTPTTAVIEWRTDEVCTGQLRYGLSGLGLAQSVAATTTDGLLHTARLTGLEPMTYLYCAAAAKDTAGNEVTTLRRGFCTPRGAIGDRNSPFGVFGQGLVYSRQLGAAGARWYSDYWDWQQANPARGRFDWTQAEQRMARARDSGVNLMVTFWGTPGWVRPSHPDQFTYGPDDLQDACDFFQEMAGHCRGRVDWWLPWIEPNVARDTVFGFPQGYWANRPHARSYAAYQRAAYEGAKAGNPDGRVVGMGTAGVDLDFIRKCYDEGAADSFDVMNVHYYAIGAPLEEQQPERLFADLRALMAQYGDGEKPILCSEGGGASSGLPGTTEETQADHVIRIFIISIANQIGKLCWTFELDEKPYGSKRVDMIMWMGFFRFDPATSADHPAGEPKPSLTALRTMTGALRGTEYVGPVALGPGRRAYRFAGEQGSVVVAWAEKGEGEAELPWSAARAQVVDRNGTAREVAVTNGRLSLRLTGSPVFVRE